MVTFGKRKFWSTTGRSSTLTRTTSRNDPHLLKRKPQEVKVFAGDEVNLMGNGGA